MSNGNIIVDAFDSALSLLGVGYAEVEFEKAMPRRDSVVTCEVPENTKHVLVAVTCVAFSFGSVQAPQEAPFCRMLHQVVKREILNGMFKVDVRAFIQAKSENVPWSGVIQLEIMCFG